MYCAVMSDRTIITYDGGRGRGANVNHREVLYVGVRPDADVIHFSAHDDLRPDTNSFI